MSVATKAEISLQRMVRFTNSFPKPGPTQGVRADAVRHALLSLEPLARKISQATEGAKKGGYSGAGYLTGPVVTKDDRECGWRILYELEKRLPSYGTKPLEADLYNQIKERSQRLLMVATDLDLDETLLDKASRAWDSVSESVVELARKVKEAADVGANVANVLLVGALLIGGVYVLTR
jgi:hypothetical protein